MINEEQIAKTSTELEIPLHKVREAAGFPVLKKEVKTIKEAQNGYKMSVFENARAYYLAWDELSLKEGQESEDIFKLRDLWDNAPDNGKARRFILKKVRALCLEKLPTASYLEAERIFEEFCRDEFIGRKAAVRAIEMVSNHEEAINAYQMAECTHDYEIELKALKKVCEFA